MSLRIAVHPKHAARSKAVTPMVASWSAPSHAAMGCAVHLSTVIPVPDTEPARLVTAMADTLVSAIRTGCTVCLPALHAQVPAAPDVTAGVASR